VNYGWIYSPRDVEAILTTLPMPLFGLSASDIADDEALGDFFYWELEPKVLGGNLGAHDQDGVGSCVGHGCGGAVEDLMVIEIACDNEEPEEFPVGVNPRKPFVSVESIYGPSRVEIGKSKISGDGSVGAWASKSVQEYGVLFRKRYGNYDLTEASPKREREWGRIGLPDELEPEAREHLVQTISLFQSGEELFNAARAGIPGHIASSQGFTTVRDKNGFCAPKGTWQHDMRYRGAGIVKGNRPAVAIGQSWRDSPNGPNKVTLESGRELELPQGVFLVDLEVIDRMVRRGRDSWGLSKFVGFRRRRPKWYV
jgi:hypothetical protein